MWRLVVLQKNPASRALLIEIIRNYACCTMAESATEALHLFQQAAEQKTQYDLLIMDDDVPCEERVGLLAYIRSQEHKRGANNKVPVILLSDKRDPQCFPDREGYDDYLIKPLVGIELLRKISDQINQKRRLRPTVLFRR